MRLRDGQVGLLHTLACYQIVLHVRRRSWPFCHSVGSKSVVCEEFLTNISSGQNAQRMRVCSA